MAGNNADPFAGIGDQTYVDFVALPVCTATNNRTATTTPSTSSPRVAATTTSVTSVFNRSLSIPSATSATHNTGASSGRTIIVTPRRRTESDVPPDIPPRPTDPIVIAQGEEALRRMRGDNDDSCQATKDTNKSAIKIARKSSQRKTWSGSSVARVAIASHTYIPVSSDDLAIKKGDVLEILETDHRWWWYAKNPATGKRGYVPCNHVRYEIPLDHDRGWNVETVLFDKTESGHAGRFLVHAVGNFDCRSPEELTCRIGDIFVVLNDRATWWFVRHVKTGKEGFVPSVFLKRCSTYNVTEEDEDEPLPEGLGVEL